MKMAGFGYSWTPMEFGMGVSRELGKILAQRGHKKILAVYDPGLKAAGVPGPILDTVREAGIDVVVYEDVTNDPPPATVNAGGELARKEKVDGIVAIGGGSSIDTAKGINVLINSGEDISKFFVFPKGPEDAPKPGVPLYTIPTTAGTGSEVTFIGVFTEVETSLKKAVGGPPCIPTLAIIDPMLTVGLPAKITAPCGCDAFAHCFEGVTGRIMNPVSDALGLNGIARIAKWLPVACADPNNEEARENLMYASTFGGMSFMHTSCHIGHSIGHNVGLLYHIPHGAACAAALPEVIKFTAKHRPKQVKDMMDAMGVEVPEGADLGEVARKAVRDLFESVGVGGLKSIGVPESDLSELADRALADGCMFASPAPMTKDDMMAVLKEAYV